MISLQKLTPVVLAEDGDGVADEDQGDVGQVVDDEGQHQPVEGGEGGGGGVMVVVGGGGVGAAVLKNKLQIRWVLTERMCQRQSN